MDKGISVVVPVYNTSRYLRRCIDSLLTQTFCNLQIILVDDGSTDFSEDIILTYQQHDRIEYIFNDVNQGAGYCRNAGLAHAKYDYIGFVDSDDFVPADYYERLHQKITETDADIAVCDFHLHADGTELFVKAVRDETDRFAFMDHGMAASPCNKIFKKTLLEAVPFPIGIINEDVACVIPAMAHAETICYVPGLYYHYIQHRASVQNAGISPKRFDVFKAVDIALERIKDSNDFERYRDAILYHQLVLLPGIFTKIGSFRERAAYLQTYAGGIKRYPIDTRRMRSEFLKRDSYNTGQFYGYLIKVMTVGKVFRANCFMQMYRIIKRLRNRGRMVEAARFAETTGSQAPVFCPLVSVVIPVYNGSLYINDAIDSVLKQTYKNVEVIVVNDGSDDGGKTDAIIRSYGDAIHYIRKENGGVATALNAGIDAMRGEYFTWLSHDDLYEPNKILNEINIVTGLKDKTTFIAGGYTVISESGTTLYDANLANSYTREELGRPLFCLFRGGINGCATLIHKSHFKRVGQFDTALRTTQDYDLWFRILKGRELYYYNACHVKSRSHAWQGSRVAGDLYRNECDRLWIRLMSVLTDEERTAIDGSPFLFYINTHEFLTRVTACEEAIEFAKQQAIRTAPGYLRSWAVIVLFRRLKKMRRYLRVNGWKKTLKRTLKKGIYTSKKNTRKC